MEAIRNNFP